MIKITTESCLERRRSHAHSSHSRYTSGANMSIKIPISTGNQTEQQNLANSFSARHSRLHTLYCIDLALEFLKILSKNFQMRIALRYCCHEGYSVSVHPLFDLNMKFKYQSCRFYETKNNFLSLKLQERT